MVEPALKRQSWTTRAALRDDDAVRQAWLRRCPPRLARAVLAETDPEAHLSHTVYDLVEALAFTPDPARAAATYLADLSDSRGTLPARLDHRLRRAYDELARAGLTSTSAAETDPAGRVPGDAPGAGDAFRRRVRTHGAGRTRVTGPCGRALSTGLPGDSPYRIRALAGCRGSGADRVGAASARREVRGRRSG